MAHAKNIGEPFMARAKKLYNIPCALFGTHTKKVIKTKLKRFSAEQLDLFRTILGVKQVSQKCYTNWVGNPLTVGGKINV